MTKPSFNYDEMSDTLYFFISFLLTALKEGIK